MMKTLLLILSSACFAQTMLPPGQLKGSASAAGQVLVSMPFGMTSWALLGDAISLDVSGIKPVLRVSLPAGTRLVRLKAVATATPAQTYSLSGVTDSSQVLVFRNGLLQAEGEDYDASGGSFTFRQPSEIRAGDIIQLVALL